MFSPAQACVTQTWQDKSYDPRWNGLWLLESFILSCLNSSFACSSLYSSFYCTIHSELFHPCIIMPMHVMNLSFVFPLVFEFVLLSPVIWMFALTSLACFSCEVLMISWFPSSKQNRNNHLYLDPPLLLVFVGPLWNVMFLEISSRMAKPQAV